MRSSYCLFVYLQPEPGSRAGVAVYDSRVGAVIRRCIKPSHVIHLALHKQVFLYIEPSSLHITIDLVLTWFLPNTSTIVDLSIATEAMMEAYQYASIMEITCSHLEAEKISQGFSIH